MTNLLLSLIACAVRNMAALVASGMVLLSTPIGAALSSNVA